MLRWFLILLAILFAVVLVLNVRHWWRGFCGLDQWPDPHGRYYRQWLKLPNGAGDYYVWLAHKMGDQEPWKTWAKMDKTDS